MKAKEAAFVMVLMAADSQLGKIDMEDFLTIPALLPNPQNHPPPKKDTAWAESYRKELLAILVRMLKCSYQQLMDDSDRGTSWEGLSFLLGLSTRCLTVLHCVHGKAKGLGFGFVCLLVFFFWEDWEVSVIKVYDVKFSNSE